ncbi:unnamed protein product [Amoebophrya sp. A120]|nr:unnamed protein product [Amoebophrya sp. A120]|eukprot:GSA120T00004220001.1
MSNVRPQQLTSIRQETAQGLAEMRQGQQEEPHAKRQKVENLQPLDASLADIRREAMGVGAAGSSSSSSSRPQTMTALTGNANANQLFPQVDSENAFWFYYQDAHEDVSLRNGVCRVLLFGKIFLPNQQQVSSTCCVAVHNMKRNVYLLLREQGLTPEEHARKAQEAFLEFREAQLRKSLRQGRNADAALAQVTWKAVKRKYVFEREIPHPHGELQWCKVTFDGSCSQIHDVGGTHYSDIFGTQTSFLEMLFKKRSLKGPQWIRVTNAQRGNESLSYCRFEAHIPSHKCEYLMSSYDLFMKKKTPVTKMPSISPPITVAILGVKTQQKTKGGQHELTYLSLGCPQGHGFQVDSPAPCNEYQDTFYRWGILRAIELPPTAKPNQKVVDYVSALRQPLPGIQNYEMQVANSEKQMLLDFLKKLQQIDPDVIVQHNAYGFGLDVLANRLSVHRVQNWDMMSRLRRVGDFQYRKTSNSGFYLARQLTVGRLVCDSLLSSRDLVGKLTNYELPSLAKKLFDQDVPDPPDYHECVLVSTTAAVQNFDMFRYWLCYTFDELRLTFNILHRLEILTLSKQLTIIGGNLWAHSLQNKRAERNEFLLVHEFYKEKYLCPDKADIYAKKNKAPANELDFMINDALDESQQVAQQQNAPGGKGKGPQYSGGLVLEPKVGLYDDFVLLLDFNSLYPSLIQEYNICFSTVQRPRGDIIGTMTEQELMQATKPPLSKDEKNEGILPRVLRRLVSSRKEVKKQIKETPASDTAKLQQLETKQKAIKLTANSMYGCLGFSNSRFHAKPIAALITQRGRGALSETQQLIEGLQYDVVYGDTDSVFVRSFTKEYGDAVKIAQKIKSEVNKKYRKLEIDLDGVFQRILLLKKKKYAGLKVVNFENKQFEQEYKGLDLVRRDWCKLSSDMGKEILEKILGGEYSEDGIVDWIHEYLKDIRKKIDNNEIPIAQYVITKGISKMPHEYPDPRNQPHVMVAKRMIERGQTVNVGLEVQYILCRPKMVEQPNADPMSDEKVYTPVPNSAIKPENMNNVGLCAFHISELEDANNNIELDKEWYLKTQIHPPLMRLLQPIPGTDSGKIAEALGMDASRFQIANLGGGAIDDEIDFSNSLVEEILNPMTRYKGGKLNFEISCPNCKKASSLQKLLGLNEDLKVIDEDLVLRCDYCGASDPSRLFYQIADSLRQFHNRYMDGFTKCTEPTCRRVSKTLSLASIGRRCENPHCRNVVKEEVTQQMFQDELNLMFVCVTQAIAGVQGGRKKDPRLFRALSSVHGYLNAAVGNSAYNRVNLTSLFGKVGFTVQTPLTSGVDAAGSGGV